MVSLISQWMRKPGNLTACFLVILPIVTSQILQRLYPIIDNRYLSVLGNEALYIHNIQYNFISFGQFVGFATYISCLVFWRREECLSKQGGVLIKHLLMAGIFTSIFALLGWIFATPILSYYKVSEPFLPLAALYLKIGLCNMVLQAIYGGIDGMLVGSQQQRKSMYIAVFLVLGNILVNRYAVYSMFAGEGKADAIQFPMMLIGISTTVLLAIAIITAIILVARKVHGWDKFHLKEMLPVWWGELGSYLIRGIVPFIYAYQLCFINASKGFLTTYQLILHLSYIFCFPLLAAMQVAIRDNGKSETKQAVAGIPNWWSAFLYTGMIPSSILLIIGAVAAVPLMRIIYGYNTPYDHVPFLAIYLIGCWFGQWGNTFTVPLRSAKKSYLVTKNFFIAEFIVMLVGTQVLIYLNMATPAALGWVTLVFSCVYASLNFRDSSLLNKYKIKILPNLISVAKPNEVREKATWEG